MREVAGALPREAPRCRDLGGSRWRAESIVCQPYCQPFRVLGAEFRPCWDPFGITGSAMNTGFRSVSAKIGSAPEAEDRAHNPCICNGLWRLLASGANFLHPHRPFLAIGGTLGAPRCSSKRAVATGIASGTWPRVYRSGPPRGRVVWHVRPRSGRNLKEAGRKGSSRPGSGPGSRTRQLPSPSPPRAGRRTFTRKIAESDGSRRCVRSRTPRWANGRPRGRKSG